MKPRTDAELLPVLLDLFGARTPVGRSPGKMTKAWRTARAREIAAAAAAAADRLQGQEANGTGRAGAEAADPMVTPLKRPERPHSAEETVAAERRRRGETAPLNPLRIPRQLGASSRDRNPFVPPNDEEDLSP
jgi:hypothetical protein